MLLWVFALAFAGTAGANYIFYQEGDSATLECFGGSGEIQYWFLHGRGPAIERGASPAPEDPVFVNTDGTLQFKNVSKEDHEGSHMCVARVDRTLKAYSVPMKVKPLPLQDLWNVRYKGMFLTGFIAALVCLTLFAVFCLVSKLRWREALVKAEDPHLIHRTSYVNPTMSNDDEMEGDVRM